jgi:hypothetical protein
MNESVMNPSAPPLMPRPQGFEIFDRDRDGKLSYDDLLSSLIEMQLSVTHPDCNALHCTLDSARVGYVTVDSWNRALAAADLDSILVDLEEAAKLERGRQEEEQRRRDAEEKKRVGAAQDLYLV